MRVQDFQKSFVSRSPASVMQSRQAQQAADAAVIWSPTVILPKYLAVDKRENVSDSRPSEQRVNRTRTRTEPASSALWLLPPYGRVGGLL
jgi:hypothetical protein